MSQQTNSGERKRMKKALIVAGVILIALIVILVFVSLNEKKKIKQEQNVVDTQVIEEIATEPMIQEQNETDEGPELEEETEEPISLKEVLFAELGEVSIADYGEADFDHDGSMEAFVVVGEEDEYASTVGTLYLVTEDSVQTVLENEDFAVYGDGFNCLEFDDGVFYLVGQYYATGDATYLFGVKNGTFFEDEMSRRGMRLGYLHGKKGTDLQITQSDYENYTDGTGHTWKTYYWYWDNGFHEYGGIEISEEQLLYCEGANEIVNQIEAGGYTISNIFYRENNIININYTDGDINRNATLVLDEGKVSLQEVNEYGENALYQSDFGGIYSAAYAPEIATYPTVFPVK